MDELDDDSFKKLEKIQANARRLHVKNEILRVREQYEKIFEDLEGDDSDLKVYWPKNEAICYPKFVNIKDYYRLKQSKEIEKSNYDYEKVSIESAAIKSNQIITKGSVMKFVPGAENRQKALLRKQNSLNENFEPTESHSPNNVSRLDSLFSLQSNYEDIERMHSLDLNNLKAMSKSSLISVRENLSLEVLWIQQAIQSRIQYLKLKRNLQNQKRLTS